jgi:hypothetical protein
MQGTVATSVQYTHVLLQYHLAASRDVPRAGRQTVFRSPFAIPTSAVDASPIFVEARKWTPNTTFNLISINELITYRGLTILKGTRKKLKGSKFYSSMLNANVV